MDQSTKYYSYNIIEACRSVLLLGIPIKEACFLYGMKSKSDEERLKSAIKDFQNAALEMDK